jgi:hypothetical protein
MQIWGATATPFFSKRCWTFSVFCYKLFTLKPASPEIKLIATQATVALADTIGNDLKNSNAS